MRKQINLEMPLCYMAQHNQEPLDLILLILIDCSAITVDLKTEFTIFISWVLANGSANLKLRHHHASEHHIYRSLCFNINAVVLPNNPH